MKDLTLTDPQPDMRYSSFTGPSLENRVLSQASSFLTSTCPALRPSSLSSTVSSSPLLSTSSTLLSFPLISTENTQLESVPIIASNLCSPYSLNPLIQSAAPPAAPMPAVRGAATAPEQPREEQTEKQELCCSEDLQLSSAELVEEVSGHEEMEMDDSSSSEIPVLDLRPSEEEEKLDLSEEFQPVEERTDKEAEMLKEKKYKLLNLVCCSLVNKSCTPGQSVWNNPDQVWHHIIQLGTEVTLSNPEFLLKLAVYTRQELNIRVTANFLLALAAHLPNSKPHVRRYFCAAVQLPSDWLEVTRIYSTCFSTSLPSCLKKALTDKFSQFSEYQLAKYNTRKHRCKHSKKKRKVDVSPKEWNTWAKLVKADVEALKKYVGAEKRAAVDKKQSEFNMKKLIKRLHIKQPAEFVMSILGKKYPADAKAFWRSGLSGMWQSERANQRMKLKQPETWETRLSQEGNNAATWQKLIDNKSLPFMAMLRNLRNMITQGISNKHHNKILNRLSTKASVIQSRQFPFRFLSAYKVIMELNKFVGGAARPVAKTKMLRGILNKIPKARAFRSFDWSRVNRQGLRATLKVPYVRRVFNVRRKLQQKASQSRYSEQLLQRYRQALEKAVEISCRYNIPPLSGHTLIIIFSDYWEVTPKWKESDFCLPPEISDTQENDSLSASPREVGLLLALMIGYSCERPQFLLSDSEGFEEIKLESDGLLENVKSVMKKFSEFPESTNKIPHSNFLSKLLEEKTKVNNIIVVGNNVTEWTTMEELKRFKKNSISEPLLVTLLISARYVDHDTSDPKTITLSGFSEQILRFIAERGSSRLLDHVERIDKLHNIPPPTGPTAKPERNTDLMPLPAVPKLRWRGVRIFISSTFRDMHGERDVLVRSIFPELRRRAAPLCLYLQEVDLRWGVTEDESTRIVETCLSEVCRSHLLLGMLGERYGLVPNRPSLPDLPQYSWLKSAPDGLSVTEMEIRQFQTVNPDSPQSRMFFYFRSPHLLSSVPESWTSDFAAESSECATKMNKLKERLRSSGFKVTENYRCEWGGVLDGKPYVKGLEKFAKGVMEDLWDTLQKLFAEESDEADLTSEIKEQEVHQDAQQRQFYGRVKLLSKAKEKVHECQKNGGVLLVEGAAGAGKTMFMAALAHALQTPDKMRTPVCDVISYSTAASQSASRVEPLLRCLVQWLRKRKDQGEELPSDTPYRDLLSEWFCLLRELKNGRSLALLVDGADLVSDAKGQGVSEWIPERLPKGVCLVLSVTASSALKTTISKKKNSTAFPLGVLMLPDRREMVQKELSVYGKKLSESAFNNQLQTLLMKKGAVSPLYLRLACEELRSYATFEKMKENLEDLPASLCELIQHGLIRLQSQYRGTGLDWALGALAISSTGLKERDLYVLLNLCADLSSTCFPITWQKVLKLARNSKSRVPMATFSQLVRDLRRLISSSLSLEPDEPLLLINPDVRSAFEKLYLSAPEDRTRAQMILAAYLWVRSDPHGRDMFLHCDAETLTQLPHCLMKCGQWEAMQVLLSSYYFLYANVRHGLLHLLLENYTQFEKRTEGDTLDWTEPSDELRDCQAFLKRHAPLLSHWPALFVQQALNEPDDSAAHVWGKSAVEHGNVHAVRWTNNSGDLQEDDSELLSTFQWTPSCVSVSPDGLYMAVGTEQGSLHLLHTNTNQEVKSLVSNCDGISGCLFLNESVIWTTSYDGQVEVWDLNGGCRTAQLNAHSNRITGCDVSSDRKHFATVSLDFALKVWDSRKGSQVASLQNPCPLNCVRFNPEGALLAVGCWDGMVRIWDWIKQENLVSLSGHQCSVRSVSFCPSPSLSLLCSGALDGEMRFWSVSGSSCVWHSQAHRGSAEALHFLSDGQALLSAGHDGTVQLWSGGLGRTVSILGEEKKLLKVTASKNETVSEDAALCIAVSGDYVAVGYHGNGIKLYSIESGECRWTAEDLRVSTTCLMWLDAESDFLLSGGLDQRLRVWVRNEVNVKQRRGFGVQKGAILALEQNSDLVASASDDFTIVLWLKRDLTSTRWEDPTVVSVLRGHQGGVTCLAFSPDGDCLLSGGKDQALMVWKVNSTPPVRSHSLPHCHGDWITGCAWTSSALLSCSNDCRLRLWDIQSGDCIREIPAPSSVGALCCWGDYVMFGSADGLLMVWKSDLGVIAEIKAHHSRLHHITIISNPVCEDENVDEGELVIATASEDGTVKIWHPLQVHHRSTLIGHSAAVQALASGGSPQFLTVSEDRSLRAWSLHTERPARQMECVSALCYVQKGTLLICGYSTGRLEVWRQSKLLVSDELKQDCICALAEMPDRRVAVGCSDCTVSVCQLERRRQEGLTYLYIVDSYSLKCSVKFLHYCTTLLGVCVDSTIIDIPSTDKEGKREINMLKDYTRLLAVDQTSENSLCMVIDKYDEITLALLKCEDPNTQLDSGFSYVDDVEDLDVESDGDDKEEESKKVIVTAAATHKDLTVCGDSKGNIWFNQPPKRYKWTPRQPAHSDRISVLRLTDDLIISASYDRTIKLWDRSSRKQVGLFVCAAPVEVLQVNPHDPSQLVCGDALGQIYFLSWRG